MPFRISLVVLATRQLDVGLRDTLAHCGGTENGVITLKPRLEATADGMALHMMGVRSADQQVLGNFSLKVSGSSREKQVKGIASRICQEVSQLHP